MKRKCKDKYANKMNKEKIQGEGRKHNIKKAKMEKLKKYNI